MRIIRYQRRKVIRCSGRIAIAVVVATAVLVVSSSSHWTVAQSAISLSACQNITTSGSYVVTENIINTNPPDGACFVITANNVTLDGGGNRLTITNGYAVDIRDLDEPADNWHDITVKNLVSNKGIRTIGDGVNHVIFDQLIVSGIEVLGSNDVTISNNTIGEYGIQVNNADRTGWSPLRPSITLNTITGGSTDVKILLEVLGGASHPCPRIDAVIDHNVITDTRADDPPPEATAAVRIRCATHTTFTNNTIKSTGTALGLYLRDESDDGVYRNNVFWSHTQPALYIAAGNEGTTHPSRNTFETNTFQTNAGHATYLFGLGTGNRFTDDVIWSTGEDFLGWYGGGGGNTFSHMTFFATGTSTHSFNLARDVNASMPSADTFTNSIFSYQSANPIFTYDNWLKSQWTGDYNVFHNRMGGVSFGAYGSSLAAWRTTSPASDAHSKEADPQLNDPARGDFTLKAGSPARGAGSDGTDIGARTFATGAPWCTEQWSCTNWSTCYAGQQTRTCLDQHACGTTVSRPATTQACVMTDTAPPVAVGDLIVR